MPRLRLLETLYEDAAGSVYRAKDAGGHRVHLRKPRAPSAISEVELVALQLATERLTGIRHPSLLAVVSGGCDPADGRPFVAIKPTEGEHLASTLRGRPLSIETATALLSQALEVSVLISELLADEGIWIETTTRAIIVTEESGEPRFLFWPAPGKAMLGEARKRSFHEFIEMIENVLGWAGREIDESEGGHLHIWLQWLKGVDGDVALREAREMLAAAAGVEPPQPVEKLVAASRRKARCRINMAKWQELLKSQRPRMPLFALLCFMLVIQAIIGWIIVRIINDSFDDELEQLNASYHSTPFTIDRHPNRMPQKEMDPPDSE